MQSGERITVVGLGEIGRRFANAAAALGMAVTKVPRDDDAARLPSEPGEPMLLCVRENDLPDVLAKIPPARGRDVVIVQNGFVDDAVRPYEGHTRAVLWFTSKGTFWADLLPSPVHGPLADTVRALINACGATAERISDEAVFRRYALEKAVWSCVVGAPLTVWGCDFTTARHRRMAEIEAIVKEACAVVKPALGFDISPQRVLATLDDTSAQLGWMRGGTKAVAWRNGKVVEWGQRYGIATPANRAILEAATRPAERVTEVE
jgi:ketopantoate reductase